VFVEGAEVDLHNAHWHGNVLLRDGHRVDQCVPAHSPTQNLCMRAYQRCTRSPSALNTARAKAR